MATALPRDETALLMALRDGDEAVFMAVVEAWGPAMLRLARAHVSSQAVAEEVVQEAWVGILRALDRFEGRSSLKTWAFRIVANIAKTRGVKESRSVPFSSATVDGGGGAGGRSGSIPAARRSLSGALADAARAVARAAARGGRDAQRRARRDRRAAAAPARNHHPAGHRRASRRRRHVTRWTSRRPISVCSSTVHARRYATLWRATSTPQKTDEIQTSQEAPGHGLQRARRARHGLPRGRLAPVRRAALRGAPRGVRRLRDVSRADPPVGGGRRERSARRRCRHGAADALLAEFRDWKRARD